MNLFDQMNDEQKDAVKFMQGPLLVLAGAGSGKTRVVTCRIANLLQNGVPSYQILGLTFTNKAAQEMKERVRHLTQNNVLICTFHSLGVRILRESIPFLGYSKGFTIYDEEDNQKILKACLAELGITDKKMDVKTIRNLISKAKNEIQMPDQVNLDLKEPLQSAFPKIYALYQQKLKQYDAVDFDDLLFLPVRLMKEYPEVREYYQHKWRFLLIDEYQDTNAAQYKMVSYLVEKHQNIFVVGDPDQSIYSWRGANIKNILNFEQDYPGAKVIRLERNYRSRSNILNAANAVISNNYNRFEKNLWSDLGPGERIKYYPADGDKAEAEFIAEKILYHQRKDHLSFNQMVVFYRTNAQSRAFEDRFLAKRIPYVIVGGLSFYQRREIKDILAFLRVVHSGADYVSLARTINLPKRGIGETTLEKIRLSATLEQHTIFSYCEALVHGVSMEHSVKLPTKQFEGLKEYVSIIRNLKELHKTSSLETLVKEAIGQTSYLNVLKEDPDSFEDRKENLDALIAKTIEWEMSNENPTLAGFLEELSLKSTLDEAHSPEERVHLMTIHNGKGLEFPVAFLAGMEEDLFPHANSREDISALEEERRLCYVGMTRAREYLYLTSSKYRYMWGTPRTQRPSRFIKEIPLEYIEKARMEVDRHYPEFEEDRPRKPLMPTPPKKWESISMSIKEHAEFTDEVDQTKNGFTEGDDLVPGNAVFHKDFGVGVIRESYQGSAGLTYKVLFSKDQRERSLVAKFAKLKKL